VAGFSINAAADDVTFALFLDIAGQRKSSAAMPAMCCGERCWRLSPVETRQLVALDYLALYHTRFSGHSVALSGAL
jgi:hypothetical protein